MPLSYRNQSINLLCKSIGWFLYDSGLRHERVNCAALYFNKDRRKALKLSKMSKSWSLEETGSSYDHKFVSSDNPGQNVWNKVKRSSIIEQEKALENFFPF